MGLTFFDIFLQDAEGVLVANIGSYMGGVDLWQNEDESYDNLDPQSMHDKVLEVVSISGTWHLGKLQVYWFSNLLGKGERRIAKDTFSLLTQ